MNPAINAFLFDLDDTLYMRSEPFIRACAELFPACASIPPKDLYDVRKKHSDDSFFEHSAGKMTKEDMLVLRTVNTLREYGIQASRAQALELERRYSQALSDICLDSKTEALLQFLNQKGFTLGVITNGPVERQTNKMLALKLERFIPLSSCIISGAVGITKPDKAIFWTAEQRLKLDPGRTWYIGDSWENDIAGANGAGWHTIWFNPTAEPSRPFEKPADYTVNSYAALSELIYRIAVPQLEPDTFI